MQFYHITLWNFILFFQIFFLHVQTDKSIQFYLQLEYLGEIHMFLQKSMKFCSDFSFEENALTLNY